MKLTLAILFGFAVALGAEIISADRKIDWELGVNAGVVGGIPTVTTIFTNFTSSATAAQINAAIASCPSNQVVKLGTGTFVLSASLTMATTKGVVLRGTIVDGTNATIIDPSHSSAVLNLGDVSGTVPGAGTSITAGYALGSSNLTVSSGTPFAVGDLVIATQQLVPGEMVSTDGANTRGLGTVCVVKAKSGADLTIWPPITFPLTSENTPLLHPMKLAADYPEMCGIEDLVCKGDSPAATYAMWLFYSANCWVKNVRTIIYDFHYYTAFSANLEMVQIYCDQSADYNNNHAGVLLGNGNVSIPSLGDTEKLPTAVTGAAIYDSIFVRSCPGVEVNGGTSGSIIAYNYLYDGLINSQAGPHILVNHSAHCTMNLYEGNISNLIADDGYFGSSSQNTIFRNWSLGWTPTYTNKQAHAIAFYSGSHSNNFVGNVLGCTNVVPDAVWVTPPSTWNNEAYHIWVMGFEAPAWGADDPAVTNTAIFHGNWESGTKTVTWSTNADHNIPDSYYLDSKPSWFYSLDWPPVEPSNGYTNYTAAIIPAGWRFLFITNPPLGGGGGGGSGATANAGTLRVGTQ